MGKTAEHYFAEHPKSTPRFGLIRAYLRGRRFEFLTASGVFSKSRIDLGTRLLIESMVLPEEGRVLDVGCGYGPIGIVVAALNPCLEVTLVDVNSRALRLAKRNIEKNRICNVEVKRGRFYEPVKDMIFDCILSNPPVSAGLETVKAIICGAPEHLKHNASFQAVFRSKVGGKRLQMIFREAFGNVEVLARASGHRVLISKKQ
ncbi:MAG: class I SAM-dependent methyltransferase [Candidatus Bathyarchaeia archaeon]|jgi:16S rRNA (guanine1207-N2)-methyltransferase